MKKIVALIFIILGFAFFANPNSASAAIYDCTLSENQTFNLSVNPSEFAAADQVTFTVSGNQALECQTGDTVYLCIDRREDTQDIFCETRVEIPLDENCAGTYQTTNLAVNTSITSHTAQLMDSVLVVASRSGSCSNQVPFTVTGVVPQTCREAGDDCCVNQDGSCQFPGNACCNICSVPSGLYCDPATMKVNNFLCGNAAGALCCTTGPLCNDDFRATNPDNPASCVCLDRSDAEGTAGRVSGDCQQGDGYVDTAIGCIPFNLLSEMAKFFLAWGLSIGGGVALLLIGLSGLMFATSSGNPDKVNSAKSLFWSAITGLGMILLSIFLLRFIGVDVLGLFS